MKDKYYIIFDDGLCFSLDKFDSYDELMLHVNDYYPSFLDCCTFIKGKEITIEESNNESNG